VLRDSLKSDFGSGNGSPSFQEQPLYIQRIHESHDGAGGTKPLTETVTEHGSPRRRTLDALRSTERARPGPCGISRARRGHRDLSQC
jgi:hypothetical protein